MAQEVEAPMQFPAYGGGAVAATSEVAVESVFGFLHAGWSVLRFTSALVGPR
jgi:hypothetical protein